MYYLQEIQFLLLIPDTVNVLFCARKPGILYCIVYTVPAKTGWVYKRRFSIRFWDSVGKGYGNMFANLNTFLSLWGGFPLLFPEWITQFMQRFEPWTRLFWRIYVLRCETKQLLPLIRCILPDLDWYFAYNCYLVLYSERFWVNFFSAAIDRDRSSIQR